MTTTYTLEMMTVHGHFEAVELGADEEHARGVYKAAILVAGPNVECVSLNSFTPSDDPFWEGEYRVLAAG
jgi:hypothetical protein